MFGPKYKKTLSCGLQVLPSLMVIVMLLEDLLKSGATVITWTGIIAMMLLGGMIFGSLWEFAEQERVNRWYRAAYWAVRLFCGLAGALIIGAAVAWVIAGPALAQAPAATGVLLLTGGVLLLVAFFVVGGLAVTGYIAQGNKETREWANSWRRTNGEAGGEPTREDTPSA